MERIIVHRANAAVQKYPLESVGASVAKGYRNLEVDITVTGQLSFKFCHTSQLQSAHLTFRADSLVFQRLATLDVSLWLADIKYPFGDPPPTDLLSNIFNAFGQHVIFAAAQAELLMAAHYLGARTAQIFRSHISPELPFEPNFFIYDADSRVERSLGKSIVYCSSLDPAKKYLADGVPYVVLDLPAMQ